MRETLDPYLLRILDSEPELRRTNLVGGCVRDHILATSLGKAAPNDADIDLEVFGVPPDRLATILSRWGSVKEVGKSFGILSVTTPEGTTYDFAQPRTEKKTGPKHDDYKVTVDPYMSYEQAALRRDFTVNAMAISVATGELFDFYGGCNDLRNGILKHTSPAFAEDALRPLRGMRFCGVFGFTAAPETIELCRSLMSEYHHLPTDRLRKEWHKWACNSKYPEKGIEFLEQTGWIELYPQLARMAGVPQDPKHHPEGDVLVHTKHCCRFMADNPEWQALEPDDRAVKMFAILCHDMAKPDYTTIKNEDGVVKITAHGHEQAGGPYAAEFLQSVSQTKDVIERVVPLVENHMGYLNPPSKRAVARLARRLVPEGIDGQFLVWAADKGGRPPLSPELPPNAIGYRDLARDMHLEDRPPVKIINGRDLIKLGIAPGTAMGALINAAYEAQLDQKFTDTESAIAWLRETKLVPDALPSLPAAPATVASRGDASGREI